MSASGNSTPLNLTPAWRALQDHQRSATGFRLRELFDQDPERFDKYSLRCGDILFDYSKHLITEETLRLLLALAQSRGLSDRVGRLFSGDKINLSENRAALHTALRASGPLAIDGRDIANDIAQTLEKMQRFCDAVRGGKLRGFGGRAFTDIVNIGIGGSDLGPALATGALAPFACPQLQIHFVSNVDGAHLAGVLARLDPETTLFVVSSKSFTTLETLANARSARDWLTAKAGGTRSACAHFAAVTSEPAKALEFGIDAQRVFETWAWVGGRYSVWSAVGLPLALAVGMENFRQFLAGARNMDEHFRNSPPERNMPVIMGLLGIWYANFFGAQSHAILPYDQALRLLPEYLQQLEMESNGKRVTKDGSPIDYATAAVIFGAPGTNGQHSFYQLLHQGTHLVPADFIGCCQSHYDLGSHHEILMSNFFAQSEALMRGRTEDEATAEMRAQGMSREDAARLAPHLVSPGNRPSSTILMRKLEPRTLGSLLALYEHKVFVQSVIWDINAFDQWGVELGKKLAGRILSELAAGNPVSAHDASTNALINHFKSNNH